MTRSLSISIGAIPIPVGPIRVILIASVSSLALAACAGRTPPPSIAYDSTEFQAAVIETEPRRPVEVVTIAEPRSEEHRSEIQSLMRTSYTVLCLKKQDKEQLSRNQTYSD